jgi:hypothetical protein
MKMSKRFPLATLGAGLMIMAGPSVLLGLVDMDRGTFAAGYFVGIAAVLLLKFSLWVDSL